MDEATEKKKTAGKPKDKDAKKKEPKKTTGPKGPVRVVAERFGSKENLVKELKALFDKSDVFVKKLSEMKGLAGVSNKKLLRLYELAAEVKQKFGSRKALIDEYAKLAGKADRSVLKEKLSQLPLGRLMDLYRTAEKKAKKVLKKKAE